MLNVNCLLYMQKVILENLELELLKLENKVRFILGVVSGDIIVNNRRKADLVQELGQKGFTPFPKKAKPVEAAVAGATDTAEEESEETSEVPASRSTFISGSEYDYLLSLAIATLTLEKVQELCGERDKIKQAVEDMKKATPRSLWLRDLDSLDAELDVSIHNPEPYIMLLQIAVNPHLVVYAMFYSFFQKLDQEDATAEIEREAAQKKLRNEAGAPLKGGKAAPRKQAPKKTTKAASSSAMEIGMSCTKLSESSSYLEAFSFMDLIDIYIGKPFNCFVKVTT